MQFDRGHDICSVESTFRPYMLSWIFVVDTPYYAFTDAKSTFKITAIPPGDYRIRVWPEDAGWIHKTGGPIKITITNAKKEKLEFRVVRTKTKTKGN